MQSSEDRELTEVRPHYSASEQPLVVGGTSLNHVSMHTPEFGYLMLACALMSSGYSVEEAVQRRRLAYFRAMKVRDER